MLKRKMLAILLPAIAAATLVGSGFSAWYFQANEIDGQSTDVSVDVTNEIKDIGTLAKAEGAGYVEPTKIVLDQGGWSNRGNVDAGITFIDADGTVDEDSKVGATFTFNAGVYSDLTAAGLKFALKKIINKS